MKISLLIISIPVIFSFNSCKQGRGSESGPLTGEEIMQADESGEVSLTREQFESMDMETGDPAPRRFISSVAANGYIEAAPTGSARIGTLVSGRVRQINVATGDRVRTGQTLFSLESYEMVLLQQNYAEAIQRLKLLKSDFERLEQLWEQNVGAKKDYLKAESEYKQMQAEVEGLKTRLEMIHLDPSVIENGRIVPYLEVRSPVSGTITRQELVLGQYVEPSEIAMEVVDEDQLRLRLELFEKAMADLAKGQTVTFFTPDQTDRTYKAILTHIGKTVSPESRTVECFAELDKEDRSHFINNMYVEAAIITTERETLAVPEEALITEQDGNFVLTLIREEDGRMTLRKVPVQTGITSMGFTEILDENLKDVLLKGTYNLWVEE
jgi:membrane fusion protein, heavy metal efflux system